MAQLKLILLYVMSAAYLFTGVLHFVMPKFFTRIIPPYLPNPQLLNLVSGAAEIILAIMLIFPQTRVYAAWGIILLLIAVFPANWHHYQKSIDTPMENYTLMRLPFQIVFILWAYWYTR